MKGNELHGWFKHDVCWNPTALQDNICHIFSVTELKIICKTILECLKDVKEAVSSARRREVSWSTKTWILYAEHLYISRRSFCSCCVAILKDGWLFLSLDPERRCTVAKACTACWLKWIRNTESCSPSSSWSCHDGHRRARLLHEVPLDSLQHLCHMLSRLGCAECLWCQDHDRRKMCESAKTCRILTPRLATTLRGRTTRQAWCSALQRRGVGRYTCTI